MTNVPPLATENIGLFCYFKPADSIVLNNCLPALQTYTQYGSYVDGTVRVWDSHAIGASSPYRGADGEGQYFANYSYGDHGDTYHDVYVRIRGDGWILAWMLRTDNRGRVVWWSDGSTLPRNNPTPTTYGTRVGRAIQIIMTVAGIGGFSWTGLQYWDYEYAGPNRLYIFGKKRAYSGEIVIYNDYYYVTVPNGVTVYKAFLTWIARIGNWAYRDTTQILCQGYVDGVQKYSYLYSFGASFDYCWISGGGGSHDPNADITSVLQETGVQHSIQLRGGMQNPGSPPPASYWTAHRQGQAVVVWTS